MKGKIMFEGKEVTIPNFLDGKKTCTNCKHPMERIPINVMYKRVEGGKILFKEGTKGNYKLCEEEEWKWCCTNCILAVLPKIL